MTASRSLAPHCSGLDAAPVPPPLASRRSRAASEALIDALLRRTRLLLEDSAEAVRRLRIHTDDTERQVEASRAFLADSYQTLEVLRRNRNSER